MPDELDNFIASVPPASTDVTPPPAAPAMDDLDHFIASIPPAASAADEMDQLDQFIAAVPPAGAQSPPVPFAPSSAGPDAQPGIRSYGVTPGTPPAYQPPAPSRPDYPTYTSALSDLSGHGVSADRQVAFQIADLIDSHMPGAPIEQRQAEFVRRVQLAGIDPLRLTAAEPDAQTTARVRGLIGSERDAGNDPHETIQSYGGKSPSAFYDELHGLAPRTPPVVRLPNILRQPTPPAAAPLNAYEAAVANDAIEARGSADVADQQWLAQRRATRQARGDRGPTGTLGEQPPGVAGFAGDLANEFKAYGVQAMQPFQQMRSGAEIALSKLPGPFGPDNPEQARANARADLQWWQDAANRPENQVTNAALKPLTGVPAMAAQAGAMFASGGTAAPLVMGGLAGAEQIGRTQQALAPDVAAGRMTQEHADKISILEGGARAALTAGTQFLIPQNLPSPYAAATIDRGATGQAIDQAWRMFVGGFSQAQIVGAAMATVEQAGHGAPPPDFGKVIGDSIVAGATVALVHTVSGLKYRYGDESAMARAIGLPDDQVSRGMLFKAAKAHELMASGQMPVEDALTALNHSLTPDELGRFQAVMQSWAQGQPSVMAKQAAYAAGDSYVQRQGEAARQPRLRGDVVPQPPPGGWQPFTQANPQGLEIPPVDVGPSGQMAESQARFNNWLRTQGRNPDAPPTPQTQGATDGNALQEPAAETAEAQRPDVQADERRPQGPIDAAPVAPPPGPAQGQPTDATDAGELQRPAGPQLLNRPRSPALAPVAPRGAFSRDDLMRRIKDLHAQQGGDAGGGGVPLDVHQFAESLPQPWTFLRDGPYAGEVKAMLAEGEGGTSMARSGAVRFTDDPSQAGGEDAINAFRERYGGNGEDVYWQLARERSGRTNWQDTLASARASPDPELQLLAAIHDNLPEAAARKPQQIVAGEDLPTWSQFELNGHQMRVEEDADGYRVLRDGDDYPVLPVDALPQVPIDKGTFRKGAEPSVPEGDVFPAEFNAPAGAGLHEMGAPAASPRPSPAMIRSPTGQAARRKPPPPPKTPRVPVDPIAGGEPKKLKQIILDAGHSLGKAVRRSKLQRGVGGTYFPGSTRTVIKYDGNLDVTAHELAHLVDDRTSLVGAFMTGRAPFDSELIPHFSAHGSAPPKGAVQLPYLRAEGVAEWMRAWMVNPAAAEAAAPQFFKHFVANVPAAMRAKIRAFGDDIRRHFGLPDVQKVLSNVHTEADAPSIAQRLKRFVFGSAPRESPFKVNAADRVITEFFDDLQPVIKATHVAAALRDDLKPRAGDYAVDQHVIDGIRTFAGGSQRFAQVLATGPVKFRSSNPAAPFEKVPGVDGGAEWLLGTDLMKGMTPEQVRSAHRDAQAMLIGERVLEKAAQIVAAAQAKFAANLPPGTTLAAALANPVLKRRYDRIMDAARQRAGRLGGFGGGVEMDDVVAAKALAELAADPKRQALAKQMADRYRKWADANLQYLLDGGRKTKEQIEAIRASNQFYADFHRVMDEVEQQSPGGRLGNVKQPIHRFKGSTRQLENPFVNLLMQTAKVMRETDRNAVLREFTDLLRSDRGMYEGAPRDLDAIGSRARPGDDDAIKIYVDGKAEHWQFQPDVHRALKGLGQAQDMNWLARGVSLVAKRIPQWAITHNPGFVFRQLFKDAISRSILSESGFRPWDVAAPQSPSTDPTYKLAGGAQGPGYMADAPEYHRFVAAALNKLARTPGTVLALPGRALKHLMHGVEELGDARSRKAEYQRAYQIGLNRGMAAPEAARFAAARTRDLADWAMAGRVIRFLKPYVPFLNPGIQGIGRAWRGARANPRGFAFRMLAFVLIPRLLAYLWNSQDEDRLKEYRQLPAWRRDLTLNFKVGHVWLSIPNPYELGIFGAAVERALDAIDGGNKHPAEGLGRNVVNSLSPVDESFAAGPLKPFIELMANHDFFFNRPIVPQYEEDKALALRDTGRASRLGKVMADALGLLGLEADPRKVDHFTYSMLGGLGTVLQDASDVGRDDKPATRWLQSGVGLFTPPPAGGSADAMQVAEQARRLGDDNSTAVRDLQAALRRQRTAKTAAERDELAKEVRDRAAFLRDFYERHGEQLLQLKERGMQAGAATKGLADQKPADKAAFAQNNRQQLGEAAQAQAVERAMGEIRANMEKVYDSSLTEPVKRARLKLLDAAIDRLVAEHAQAPRKAG